MPQVTELMQRNITRARYSLPYLTSVQRDLITLIPALLSAGESSCGIHGHAFNPVESSLLATYMPDHAPVPVVRLADWVKLESVIAIPRPSLAHASHLTVQLIAIPKPEADDDVLNAKLAEVRVLLEEKGLAINPTLQRVPMPQRLIYDIMRLGVVLAGKHPVIRAEEIDDATLFIGPLESIVQTDMPPEAEWSVFSQMLENEVRDMISTGTYPILYSIPSVNPYFLPFLPILNHYEERFDTARLEKLRICLYYLFAAFAPTQEAMAGWSQAWKLKPLAGLETLSVQEVLRVRTWLIPAGKAELPVGVWPPLGAWAQPEIHLSKTDETWGIIGLSLVKHAYPWVVLAWGALTGLIGDVTYIHRHGLRLRRDARDHLVRMVGAVGRGADIIVPPDHAQGSIRVLGGRFYYSGMPFALLDKGIKFSLDLDEPVIRKATLDDTGIEHLLKKGGH